MPNPAAKHRIPVPRGLAVLLSTAALALVLSAPAHAQVAVDYSQLDGISAPPLAPVYDDRRSVQSPLAPGQATMLDGDETPTIIGGKVEQLKSSSVASPKSAIALKPLPKWHMPVPAQPISLGARGPLLLHPPGSANPMIADLAKQSPVENSKTAELHLRPPAPKPPVPVYAQNGVGIAPPMRTIVAPMPVTQQIADNTVVPMPMTQIGMSINPVSVPVPQTQVAETSMGAPVISQTQIAMVQPVAAAQSQNDLRAEDVVALDLGAPKHDEVPDVPAAAPQSKQSNADLVAPPEPVAPKPTKTALSTSPQFVSSLAADDVPSEHNNTNNHLQHDADAMPPPVLRVPESTTSNISKTDNDKNHKLASAAPPSFTGSLSDDEDAPAAKAIPAIPVQPVAAAVVKEPKFTSSLAEDDNSIPDNKVAMAHNASAATSAPDMKMGYLREPTNKPEEAISKSENSAPPAPIVQEVKGENGVQNSQQKTSFVSSLGEDNAKADNAAPENTATEVFDSEPSSDLKSARGDIAPLVNKKVAAKKTGYLKEPPVTAVAAPTEIPDPIAWNNTPATAAPIVASVSDSHASAQQAADIVSDTIAQDDIQKKKMSELVKSQADAAAKEQAEAEAKSKADELAQAQDAAAKVQADALVKAQMEAELKVQAEAKTKAEAEAKAKADELAAAQADAKAKSDELAKVQADAKAKAEAAAASQAAAIAKAQADAELKAQSEAKTQIAAAAKGQADAQAQMDAMAKAQTDELAKVRAEADANKERLAELMQRQAEIEAQAKAESSMVSVPQGQIKTAAAVPPRPMSKTEVMELPKVVEKSPVREAAISAGAISDASGAAVGSSSLVQQTVLFQSGSSVVPGDASPTIQQLAQNMKNNTAARIVINAYADTSVQAGSAARRLSLQRAILVRDELNKMGVPINRMAVRAQTSDPGTINPDRVEISVE